MPESKFQSFQNLILGTMWKIELNRISRGLDITPFQFHQR